MPYPPTLPGVYGLPRPSRAITVEKTVDFTTYTPGTPVTVPIAACMLLATVSNQYLPTAVTQTGVTWTKVVDGGQFTGNYAVASLWVGIASASATTSLTISGSSNLQRYFLCNVSGINGTGDNTTPVTNNTTASIVAWRGVMSFVVYFTRGGTLVGPTESGWRNLVTNYNTGTGQATVAWKPGATGSATITGRSDNSIELLAGLL